MVYLLNREALEVIDVARPVWVVPAFGGPKQLSHGGTMHAGHNVYGTRADADRALIGVLRERHRAYSRQLEQVSGKLAAMGVV